MNFKECNQWLKDHDLTCKLEAYGGCHPDTILVYKDGAMIYEGDYEAGMDYSEMVEELTEKL